MSDESSIQNVMVTGATGFVGRSVVRELLKRGLTPVCLVRSPRRLYAQHREVSPDRLLAITGSLNDRRALQQAAEQSHAVIHLVGIIIQRRLQGRTFRKIHIDGAARVIEAAQRAAISRFIHMSALGARGEGASAYQRTKFEAERLVRESGLAWTVFRPSIIHGPDGEFMQLLKAFVSGWNPPLIPYFGNGRGKVQPVSVKDVAYCFVEAMCRPLTAGKSYSLGGPKAYTWIALYDLCRRVMPRAKRWKPVVGLPVAVAKLAAFFSAPPLALAELVLPSLGKFRFDAGQVMMAQEDSVCDPVPAEQALGIRMSAFEPELRAYADRIR